MCERRRERPATDVARRPLDHAIAHWTPSPTFSTPYIGRNEQTGRVPRVQTAEFRTRLVGWLDEHFAELTPTFAGVGTLDEQMAQLTRVKRALFDADWIRWGWPESVGGLGGPSILRAVLGEEITSRDLVVSGFYSMTEVLAPTLARFAPPDLAREEVP